MNEVVIHERPMRDGLHYLESAIFLVEDNLFKVPKAYFEKKSGIFRNIFTRDDCEESSDEKPIRLNAIKPVDFERFLAVLYPVRRPAIMSRLEWDSALKLSTMWKFTDIRDLAIQKLSSIEMKGTDMVMLGKEYGVASLVLKGYIALAKSEQTISTEDGQSLGLDTTIKLFQIREARVNANFVKYKNMYKRTTEQYDYNSHIQLSLAQELAEAETAPASVDPTILPSQCLGDRWLASPTVSLAVRNEQFYMESIVFLVETILFRVPHACFEHASIFDTIFTLPFVDNLPVDGSDDEHPFKLEGVTKTDFRAFLKVLYPQDFPFRRALIDEEEWLAVLRLSTMWDFFDVRKLAIEELSKVAINPVTKVLLAREYEIQEWLLAGYTQLAKRNETISFDEAGRLGKDTAILIFQIREESLGPLNRTTRNCTEGIRRAFGEEMEAVQEAEASRGVYTSCRVI